MHYTKEPHSGQGIGSIKKIVLKEMERRYPEDCLKKLNKTVNKW